MTPLVKIETPRGPPLFLTSHRCRSRAWTRAFSLHSTGAVPNRDCADDASTRIYKCGRRLRSERFRSAPRTDKRFRGILSLR